MTKILINLTCFFGCAFLGASMVLFTGWPLALMAAGLCFLATQHVNAGFTRRADKRAAAREFAQLRRMTLNVEQGLSDARQRLAALDTAIDERTNAQSRKIVAELKVLESLMRDFAGKISRSVRGRETEAQVSRIPSTGPAAAYLGSFGNRNELLETIRASLEENRVDLYLQPIVSLPQRKLRYYEALSRLRDAGGQVIMPSQYIRIAGEAGLMSVVDNLLLFRCVQVLRRLATKTREIGIFCNISAETLADGEFFPQFLDYMAANRDLSGLIIFEFAQEAVLKAGPAGEKNLARLAEMGFALSMDHVETLALDFVKLKRIGFSHLKVRATTLVDGMSGAGAAVAAEDFKKLLSRHGLNLIAERVENEKTVLQLLDYAVDFAQGYLFGEPRAVRDDASRPAVAMTEAAPVIPFKRAS
ncbi:MAG: EAL domain-containing protein [Alphaproteobacteria bacterium]|nr:EAL domain-containing protein [Alphaproteobacteria bacterium]